MTYVSQAPLAKLQAYKRRMGWNMPWVSSAAGDFNFDLGHSRTEEQTREAIAPMVQAGTPPVVQHNARSSGTDVTGYLTESPGFSAFVLDDGTVYRTYTEHGPWCRVPDGLLRDPRPRAERTGRRRPVPGLAQSARRVLSTAHEVGTASHVNALVRRECHHGHPQPDARGTSCRHGPERRHRRLDGARRAVRPRGREASSSARRSRASSARSSRSAGTSRISPATACSRSSARRRRARTTASAHVRARCAWSRRWTSTGARSARLGSRGLRRARRCRDRAGRPRPGRRRQPGRVRRVRRHRQRRGTAPGLRRSQDRPRRDETRTLGRGHLRLERPARSRAEGQAREVVASLRRGRDSLDARRPRRGSSAARVELGPAARLSRPSAPGAAASSSSPATRASARAAYSTSCARSGRRRLLARGPLRLVRRVAAVLADPGPAPRLDRRGRGRARAARAGRPPPRRSSRLAGDADEFYPYLGGLLEVALEREAAARTAELSPEALQWRTFEVVGQLFARLAEDGPLVARVRGSPLGGSDLGSSPRAAAVARGGHAGRARPLAAARARSRLLGLARARGPRVSAPAARARPRPARSCRRASCSPRSSRPAQLPAELEQRVLEAADGNPFFLEELVRSLADVGALVRARRAGASTTPSRSRCRRRWRRSSSRGSTGSRRRPASSSPLRRRSGARSRCRSSRASSGRRPGRFAPRVAAPRICSARAAAGRNRSSASATR